MAEIPPYPGAPRWVKIFAAVAFVLFLAGVALLITGLGGPHGPDRHMRSGDAAGASGTRA
jgi:hypothetical protein